MTDLQLPGGVKVSVPEGSFNYSLHQWLAGTTDTTVPKRFVFDNLNFETGIHKAHPGFRTDCQFARGDFESVSCGGSPP